MYWLSRDQTIPHFSEVEQSVME